MTALSIFKTKIVRKIFGSIKEEEEWRIRTSSKVQDILQGTSIAKFINSLSDCMNMLKG
jgi:hypothetical protein